MTEKGMASPTVNNGEIAKNGNILLFILAIVMISPTSNDDGR